MAEKDRELVEEILAGDRDAFGDLVERYGPLVHGIILEKIRRPGEVEDIMQEVFSRAYEELPRLRDPAKFAPWLSRIAANSAVSWLRRHRIRLEVETVGQALTLSQNVERPDQVFENREIAAFVWEALDRLPPEYRRIVVLYHMERCTQREIARFLGIKLSTVKWRLNRAWGKLRQEMRELVGQGMGFRSREKQKLREKVMVGLPIVAFFRPVQPRGLWMMTRGWRGWLTLSCVGTLGLLGIVYQELHHSSQGDAVFTQKTGTFRVLRREAVLPEMSVFWNPRRPRVGQGVRFEASGVEVVREGEVAELHYITDPYNPVDHVVPLERENDVWVAEVQIPEGATAVFFYVSGKKENRQELLDPPWTPGQQQKLRRYRRYFLVHDEKGQPVRDAEFTAAAMGQVLGQPFAEVQVHLSRETARYPDNVKAYNERWFYTLRTDSSAEMQVRKEQRALKARFADKPEVLMAIGRYAGPHLPETYRELQERFPNDERTETLAFMWSRFYALDKDTVNQVSMLEEVIRSFPESHYVDDAYADLAVVLAATKPERAVRLADSLISGKVGLREEVDKDGLSWWDVKTAEGKAYQVRFELFLMEGDVDGALALAERLMTSGLDDPLPYQYIGRRLAGDSVGIFRDVPECPQDLSLAVRMLEAGRPWVQMEHLLARLEAKDSSSLPARIRENRYLERARSQRSGFLKHLGRCYLTQERFEQAATCLQEVVDLQQKINLQWPDDEIYLLLGAAREGAKGWEDARKAYLQVLELFGSHPQAEEGLARLYEREFGDLEGFSGFLRNLRSPAPDFTLTDAQGQTMRLSDFAGRPVLLSYERFFFRPFNEENAEILNEWERRFGEDLSILYVCAGSIDAERFRILAGERAGSLRVALDDGSVYEHYRPSFSTLFLIDRSGKLRLRKSWRGEEHQKVLRKIEEILAEERKTPKILEAFNIDKED